MKIEEREEYGYYLYIIFIDINIIYYIVFLLNYLIYYI